MYVDIFLFYAFIYLLQCFQNKPSAVASDGNFLICDAYFPLGKLYDK